MCKERFATEEELDLTSAQYVSGLTGGIVTRSILKQYSLTLKQQVTPPSPLGFSFRLASHARLISSTLFPKGEPCAGVTFPETEALELGLAVRVGGAEIVGTM